MWLQLLPVLHFHVRPYMSTVWNGTFAFVVVFCHKCYSQLFTSLVFFNCALLWNCVEKKREGKKFEWEKYMIWNSTSVFDSLNQIASTCVCMCTCVCACVCVRACMMMVGGGGEIQYIVFLITYIYTSGWKKEILLYFRFGDHDIVYSDNKVIPWKEWDVHYSYVTVTTVTVTTVQMTVSGCVFTGSVQAASATLGVFCTHTHTHTHQKEE